MMKEAKENDSGFFLLYPKRAVWKCFPKKDRKMEKNTMEKENKKDMQLK